ncbi:Proline-rich basic protein 1 [Bagarius yarrelli]|uniref:Proline-rich basic protein 1 n=1 Tax=Bagarius yarrelli TaxID=175774 RepID=A0A556U912_BAGYA|nr:Proline-rich basic protein 1 [Bagarius yarrelli]
MESWVLDGDSYSFLRSTPSTFNLQHLDGPNRVEIFDITNIPSHRGAISETNCLCDIFGDDCESPSLSSSPASTAFLKKDLVEHLPVEDVNDSSGSYHTANSSEHLSDGSDTYEDSKGLLLSEELKEELNQPASNPTLLNDKSEVTSANGSLTQTGYQQECCSAQDTSLKLQVKNSSDQQLVTSTSEFRDTNIRVTGSTQEINSSHLLSENKTITDQIHATSSELRDSDSAERITNPDPGCITKQKNVSSSEKKKSNLMQKIITPDSLPENSGITEHRHTTTSEVREADSKRENKQYNQRENSFTQSTDSTEYFKSLAAGGSHEENNGLGSCVVDKENNSNILPTGNIPVETLETVESNSTVDLTKCLNNVIDFTSFHKTASDSSTKDETVDLRKMSAPVEHQDVPNTSAFTGTFFCEDKEGLSESETPNIVPSPTDNKDNTRIDVASTPQPCTISSEATTLSFFLATTDEPSSVMSELCSSSAQGDLNSSEPPIIIHSPTGFTLCPSPEFKNKTWFSKSEDLEPTPKSPEKNYRPTDKDSVSSYDSKICPTPEPRSIASTPEEPTQNVFRSDPSPTPSSMKLRSASCSPEIHIVTCSSLSQHSKSPQSELAESEFLFQNEVREPTCDEEKITYAESFMSATLSTKEDGNKSIYSLSSGQESISCPSTTLLRDTVLYPDPNRMRCTESPTLNTLPTNTNSNMAIPTNVLLQDMCIISPHLTVGKLRGTESPDVHETRSEEKSISTTPLANETKSHSSNEGYLPSSLLILCPKDTASSDVVEAGTSERFVTAILTIKDIENVVSAPVLQPLSTEEGISRPASTLSAPRDTVSSNVNEIRCDENPATTTVLTNESCMPILPIDNLLSAASNNTVSFEAEKTRYALSSITNIPPIKEIENVVITPVTQLSLIKGGIFSSPPRDAMFPDVLETRCMDCSISTLSPSNMQYANMATSPISNTCLAKEALSSPPLTLNLPINTSSSEVDGINCKGIPLSATVLTNEMTCSSNSPLDSLLTEGISRTNSDLGRPRETLFLDVDEISKSMVISPISNYSTTKESISRSPSPLSLSRSTTSVRVDGLRCAENSISSILSKNLASNMSISPVLDISPTNESISKSGTPRDSVTPDGGGVGCLNISPTDRAISPVCNLLTIEQGISNLSIPRDTMPPYVEETKRSNDISTNENNDAASGMSNLITISNMQTDPLISLSSPKMRYHRCPNRSNDHTPAPEICISKGFTKNHLLAPVSEKVGLPLIIPVDGGQTDDTSYKMSITSSVLPRDDCTHITSVRCCHTDTKNKSPEPPAPKLSVKQIKENWERMNENISNSLNPWETSNKMLSTPTAKKAKEGNDNAKEMLKGESVGKEQTFGQMAMRPGESPCVVHSPSVVERQSCKYKWGSGERVIQEGHTLEKGVGNIAEGIYRGKQVELSFSTRNRKGPANHSPAASSRDPKSGISPRYFESPLATRRQESLLKAQNMQKEDKTSARRVRPTSQSRYSGAGCFSSECTSETSSMGSEFDEADSEVKWFTDKAFSSLSSPQVDYLDVYNSSHGSSTNVSQYSTVDSPGSATWIIYADLHKSLHEKDDVLRDPSSFLPPCTLDSAKPFEMSSFECVDVAMENKEESKRGKRTVPKRQIQFIRRNNDESMCTENNRKEIKEIDLLSTQICSRDTFARQHSTPASMREDLVQGGHETQTGKKMLQKSTSLDESSSKSKIASSVIKSVLSKKMDSTTKQFITSEPYDNTNKHIESISIGESAETERQISSLPPECSLSSEDFVGKQEKSPYPKKKSCGPKVPPKPAFKANFYPPHSNPAAEEFQEKPIVGSKTKPIMINAFESKMSEKQITDNSEKEANTLEEKTRSDSSSFINQTPKCTAIYVASKRKGMTNCESKQSMILETYKQQEGSSSTFLSKTPDITLKPCTIKDKNTYSLKESSCPELKIFKDTMCEPSSELEETSEGGTRFKFGEAADNKEDNEKNREKSVLHKVRDVRKLVKNTYNLSFKASSTTYPVEDVVPEKQREMPEPENPHHLHIECKAISLKPCNKLTNQQDVTNTANELNKPQTDTGITRDAEITNAPAKTFLPNVQHSDVDLFVVLDKCDSTSISGNCEQNTELEMPSRPQSKEISTLVFLQDDTAMSMENPTSPTSLNLKTANSSHSVSMLRKEKGMQADIGVCDVLRERLGAKPKHINRLEIPLQTHASEEALSEFQKVNPEDADLLPEQKASLKSTEGTVQVGSSLKPKEVKVHPSEKTGHNQSQRDLLKPPKEQEIPIATSSKTEVRAFSSRTKIDAMPVATSKEIELPIQVRSISSERPKPSVLPKQSYKQPFKDIPKTDITPTTSILKGQTPLKSESKIISTSTTVTNSEQPINAAPSSTKTLAVSAVSSHKPQTIPVTTMASFADKSSATTGRQEVYITSVENSSQQQQGNIQEQAISSASYASNYQSLTGVSQASTYIQPTTKSSCNQLHTDDFHFPTSDDPPSYDERESFSPLQLSDLPPKRQNRYQPTNKHSLCSCTSCTQPQFGQPFHGSQNQTPPAPCSPGQVISYPGAPPQAQVRPRQSRPDGQPSNYPLVSMKTTLQQAPAMIQPIHHSYTCPAPAIQPYGNEQQQPSIQHMDRHSGNQRSPHAPSGATYREQSRSPNIAPLDPRSQFFNPQELSPGFGHEYGSDGPGGGAVLYPENASGLGYSQGTRRVLLDTETGKYFYVEVPMQPLRKMLFDPEIGQYVEVLIPQQGISNSNMYPPTAVPYQTPHHGQGLYAPQYLPYAVPPHPQSAQQPRHSEPSAPTSLHQNTMGYGCTASQVPKSDVKGHSSVDQSYLEGMYYIPTRMNASPNSTPSDCYHKPPTIMPAAGGRRA